MGVGGRAWRVVRDLYRRVSSSVLFSDGHLSQPFDTNEGLRQGSVLSPLLFSIFIADVIDEWRRRGLGVRIGGRLLGGLLFADDIVLIADTADHLQQAMDIMSEHARRWRYRFSNSKCAVVVSGKQRATGRKWMLAGEEVEERDEYKHLGLLIQKNGRWNQWQEKRVRSGHGAKGAL